MEPKEAADKLRKLHRSLMSGKWTAEHIADPIAKAALEAAKRAAQAGPTPQAPALADAWYERIEGDRAFIGTGPVLTFSHGIVETDRMQAGILFGSNSAPQFHRSHRVPSWAWEAMEEGMADPQLLEQVGNAAIEEGLG
ncbi:MAG: hypothetical protein ABI725_04490 [Chloroflexota bacterium]